LLQATTILREVLITNRLTPARTRPEKTRARHIVLAPSHGARIMAHPRTKAKRTSAVDRDPAVFS
jgi:cytochrome P450 family 135